MNKETYYAYFDSDIPLLILAAHEGFPAVYGGDQVLQPFRVYGAHCCAYAYPQRVPSSGCQHAQVYKR